MNCAILAYVPPERLNSGAFIANIGHYKTDADIVLYSDCHDYVDVKIPDPTGIKKSKNKIAINNRIFLHAVEIAQQRDIKRFIYLESDCRVGCDYWDRKMFDECAHKKDMFAAGTPAVYNTLAIGDKQKNHIQSYLNCYADASGMRAPTFEAKTPRPIGCVFIMGAGAVYSTDVMADLFMGFERDANQKAITTPAFDLFVGMRCVQLFGLKAQSKLPFLTSSFSTYGNKLTTESQRIDMLKSGRFCLVHQIKSNTDCL